MRFEPVVEQTSDKIKNVDITFGGQVLTFKLEALGGRVLIDPNGFYSSLNRLLANYDNESRERIFNAYSRLHHNTSYTSSSVDILESVADMISDIFSVVKRDGVLAWARSGLTSFVVPERIATPDAEDSTRYHPSSSYTTEEYYELCGLTTVLKLLVPFFALHKEINAVYRYEGKVLRRHFLMQLVIEHSDILTYPSAEKIIDHIEYRLGSTNEKRVVEVPMGLVTEGITTEGYPVAVFNHLALHEIASSETDISDRGVGTANNISAKINSAILRYIADTKRVGFKDKEAGSERDTGDGGNTTNQETMSASEDRSSLYTVTFHHTIDNAKKYLDLALAHCNDDVNADINPYLNNELVSRLSYDEETYNSYKASFPSHRAPLHKVQRQLIGFILDAFIHIDALVYGSNKGLLMMRLLAASVATKNGCIELTKLLLSEVDENAILGIGYSTIQDMPITSPYYKEFIDGYEEDATSDKVGIDYVNAFLADVVDVSWATYYHETGEALSSGVEYIPSGLLKDELINIIYLLHIK